MSTKSKKNIKKLTQGMGVYTHPPLIFSQGYFIYQKINKQLINKFNLKKNKINSILDLGCAQGAGSIFALRSFNPKLITGVDIDKNSISVANKELKKLKINKIKFHNKNIYDFLKTNRIKYDLVIANGVLPYVLNKKDLFKIFGLIYKAMSERSLFCFSMFCDEKPFITKTKLINIKSFSPNNKFNQKALIANVDELNSFLNKNDLFMYNNTFNFQKRYVVNLNKNMKKLNEKTNSCFSYFFVIKKELYSLLSSSNFK